jgi:site-specific DNA-methyltransferase (adenine-specific)
MFNFEEMKNKIIHADCMDIIKDIPDKYFELAIVDPPYGISVGVNGIVGVNKCAPCTQYKNVEWDFNIPEKKYFDELYRVSKNQIIWGGNYFIEHLKNSSCMIVWDKDNSGNFADCELAWTSFKTAVRKIKIRWNGMLQENMKQKETRIHPTQKPTALYRWILQHYAKPGDKIIDTHSGSGSLACACHLEKFDFLAIEKDEDYYKASCERLETLRSQGTLF